MVWTPGLYSRGAGLKETPEKDWKRKRHKRVGESGPRGMDVDGHRVSPRG